MPSTASAQMVEIKPNCQNFESPDLTREAVSRLGKALKVQSNSSGSAMLAREQAPVENDREDGWEAKAKRTG